MLGDYGAAVLVFAFAVFFLGGAAKGILGIGLPLIAVPLLSHVVSVPEAIALLSVPIVVSNAYQMFQPGDLGPVLRRFWLLLTGLVVGIVAGAQLLVSLDQYVLSLVLGAFLIVFALYNLVNTRFTISPPLERRLNLFVGLGAGLFGGLTSFFGPPLMMYLIALRLPKDLFVVSIATVYFFCAIPLTISLAAHQILGQRELVLSTVALVPAFAGIFFGQRVRRLVPEETFHRVLLATLILIGLNLIRKAVYG